ncbi:MAG TPA: hypothetical protein VGP62_00030 [Bryobacteraceae bacterium]|jgi:hypothetical protein|nr:hypothetical protein [Bryobacteraceae bacterium]
MRWVFTIIGFLFLTVAVEANPVQFDTHSYNFALMGGGGGEAGVLDSDLNVETFCDNFNNEIDVPHSGYSAYLSTLTDGSDLSHTRFGSNTSWQTVTINDGDSKDATDAAIISGANALGRYQMAAFLVSQYQTNQGSNATNNGIQAAIWDIFDPSSSPAAPTHADATAALEQAAEWYADPNSNRSFLADFLIVSDSTMKWNGAGNPLAGGFQEQLTLLDPVPEPRALVWMLIGLFCIFARPCGRAFCDKIVNWREAEMLSSLENKWY